MEELDKMFSRCYPTDPAFSLWLDRQTRPTLGAKVQRGRGTKRPEVGDDTFKKMLKALTSTCEKLIPDSLTDVYFTYSMGKWQRSREFHLKAHLTTTAFLSLTDKLCEQHSLGANPVRNPETVTKMEERERIDRRGDKLRELLEDEDRNELHSVNSFCIATVNKLDHPLLCLYQREGRKITTAISAEQVPEALGILETFIETSWNQKGYAVGMVLPPKSASDAAPSSQSYQIAAIVDEGVFAIRVGKDVEAVKKSWGWVHPVRTYHPSK